MEGTLGQDQEFYGGTEANSFGFGEEGEDTSHIEV